MRGLLSLSLRLRLTLLYVGLLALLLIGFGTFLYYDTSQFLVNTTAVRVRAQAKPVIERWLVGDTAADSQDGVSLYFVTFAQSLSWDLTSADTVAVILDGSGEQVAQGKRLMEEPDPVLPDPDAIARALRGENEITYVTEIDGARHLVVLVPLRPAPGDSSVVGVVQLSTPLGNVDALLRQQRLLIGGGVLLCLSIGAVGGTWLTNSALAPVRRMILTCQRIASGDLRQRLALPQHHEIGQLSAAFDEMVDRIEASFAVQRRFSADAAHELRTPLTALQGSLEVLMRNSHEDSQTVLRLHQGMHGEVTRLNRLAEQLLDVTRLQTPLALRSRPVVVGEFLTGFLPQARLLAPHRRVDLERDRPATISADADALLQAMYNLLDNAAQHTSPGGRIEIGWRRAGDDIEIWVDDDGEGIAPGDLAHVFEPFYRGDRSRSRRRGGTGLGLALTKTIIEEHGGQISVESEQHKGARFVIRMSGASHDSAR